MGPMSLLITKVILLNGPEWVVSQKKLCARHSCVIGVHRCCFHFCTCFWFGVLCERFPAYWVLLIVQMSITPYVDFADGASHSTKNLSSTAWVIYDPAGELIDLQGICPG